MSEKESIEEKCKCTHDKSDHMRFKEMPSGSEISGMGKCKAIIKDMKACPCEEFESNS